MQAALAVEPIFDFQSVNTGSVEVLIHEQARDAEKVPVLVAENMELERSLLQWIPAVAKRVHFIRAAGGLKSASGELLPYIYTHKEKSKIPWNPWSSISRPLGKSCSKSGRASTFPSLRR